ncbi:ATP-binding cassette domain-containing protein [Kitasatospora xanthocidica]|uniref:ATP-binding cassette domain-containing protein n=1 Tax=Kitasatospora xanthocidica TaxID=83382 RepID=A0A372ZV28_9ACTN|nr:ATP-binding cassette domain-containing protein [Kitasatospora xanthocidica]RGD59282.1 ATP-binding cassette domain-containing protein [Kitasatospora xanthocidica]
MITTTNLTKRYGNSVALDGLSVEVKPGRVTGFLGPNGAGKSTTLRLVLGLDTPTAGSAVIDGRPYRELRRPLHRVGALLDAGAVPGALSGYHHLAALARSNGIGRARVHAVLEEVGLASAARKRTAGYSLGMKQRLGIAAALLGDPPVLIFDEPVNGLDPEGIRWIRMLFRRLAADGRTVLVSSHVMSEMENTADHLIVIGRGRLIADTGMADFIRQGSSGSSVTVRTPQGADLEAALAAAGARTRVLADGAIEVLGLPAPRIGDLALARQIAIHELTPRSASLEEAFMDLASAEAEHTSHPAAGAEQDN